MGSAQLLYVFGGSREGTTRWEVTVGDVFHIPSAKGSLLPPLLRISIWLQLVRLKKQLYQRLDYNSLGGIAFF
jgi:hypothetical protein